MKVRAIVMSVLAVSWASVAVAQVQPPQDRINTALARAREVGIPIALLESKIAEGKAKGVSLERMAATIERRLATLERAGNALRGAPDANDSLSVGADAIESGVSEAALRAVAENAPRDRRNVAIAVLTELVEQGHVPEAALERVRAALRRGPDALTDLPAEARRRDRDAPNTRPDAPRDRPTRPPATVPPPGSDRPADARPTRPAGTTDGRR